MENETIIDAGTSYPNSQLTVTPQASGYLHETSRWSKFLAILGFCFIGLMVLGGLFAGTLFATLGDTMPYPGLISVIYIAMALLYFFPVFYLFRFSNQIRVALHTKDTRTLEGALENLKSHYKFIGILMIILLSIYILIGGGALLTASMI